METLFTITPSTTFNNNKDKYESVHNLNVLDELSKVFNKTSKASAIKYVGVTIDNNNNLKIEFDKSYSIINFHLKKYDKISKKDTLTAFRKWYTTK